VRGDVAPDGVLEEAEAGHHVTVAERCREHLEQPVREHGIVEERPRTVPASVSGGGRWVVMGSEPAAVVVVVVVEVVEEDEVVEEEVVVWRRWWRWKRRRWPSSSSSAP